MPLGADQWENLTLEYNRSMPRDRQREMESLRTKYKALKNRKKPTGDPDCPEEVRRAKRVDYTIQQRMGVEDFDDDAQEEEEMLDVANALGDVVHNVQEIIPPTTHPSDVMAAAAALTTANSVPAASSASTPSSASASTPASASTSASASSSVSNVALPPPSRCTRRASRTPSAGTFRTGHTTNELRVLASRTPSPSIGSTASAASTTRRTIDGMINHLSESPGGHVNYLQEMMLWQRTEDRRREDRELQRESARKDREKEQAIERERVRREDMRLREEREDRREESNNRLMMMFMTLTAKKNE